jgi:hypothetical protein
MLIFFFSGKSISKKKIKMDKYIANVVNCNRMTSGNGKRKSNRDILISISNFAYKNWFKGCKYPSDIYESLEVIQKFLVYWNMGSFFGVMLVYIQRYIKRVGRVDSCHVFNLIFVATVVTIKFWEDFWIDNSKFSDMFKCSVEELNLNERNFLTAINYNLTVTEGRLRKKMKRLI